MAWAVQLRGDRILLRERVADDVEAIHRWRADPRVMQFVSFRSASLEETRRHLHEESIAEQARGRDREKFFLAVDLLDDGRSIGGVGLMRDAPGEADLGWFLEKAYWGRGYASEAARLLLDFGFGELGLQRMRATCRSENAASERVMQKCGMQRERVADGRCYYAVDRSAWDGAGSRAP